MDFIAHWSSASGMPAYPRTHAPAKFLPINENRSSGIDFRQSANNLRVPSFLGVGIYCPNKAHNELMCKFRALGLGQV